MGLVIGGLIALLFVAWGISALAQAANATADVLEGKKSNEEITTFLIGAAIIAGVCWWFFH